MEEYGIDTLKELVLMGCKVAKKTSDALEDDKITVIESIGIGLPLLKSPAIWKKRDELVKEINDVSEDELKDLHLYVEKNLGANDKINSWVSWSFELITVVLSIPLD